jgi:hypothetical protein
MSTGLPTRVAPTLCQSLASKAEWGWVEQDAVAGNVGRWIPSDSAIRGAIAVALKLSNIDPFQNAEAMAGRIGLVTFPAGWAVKGRRQKLLLAAFGWHVVVFDAEQTIRTLNIYLLPKLHRIIIQFELGAGGDGTAVIYHKEQLSAGFKRIIDLPICSTEHLTVSGAEAPGEAILDRPRPQPIKVALTEYESRRCAGDLVADLHCPPGPPDEEGNRERK